MTSEPVCIAMAIDRPYLHPFAVALSSLVRHSSRPVHLRFGLAADWRQRLSPLELERIVRLADAMGASAETVITDIEVDRLPPTLYITPTAFVKLALLDTCERDESLVWFDADLFARGDWTGILQDSAGHPVAGVHEPQVSFEEAWPADSRDWYVNTGVIAIDGNEWQSQFAGNWRPYLDNYESNNFRYLDQDVLNALIRDRWRLLPQRYNFRMGHSGEWTDPPIVHFAGWWKPWLRTWRQSRLLTGEWKQTFEEYAEAETYLDGQLDSAVTADDAAFWRRQRRAARGIGGWRATRHYIRGVLNG